MPKDSCQADETSDCEKIKPVANIELCLSEDISQSIKGKYVDLAE